jgi:hypothetical protein
MGTKGNALIDAVTIGEIHFLAGKDRPYPPPHGEQKMAFDAALVWRLVRRYRSPAIPAKAQIRRPMCGPSRERPDGPLRQRFFSS